MYKIKSILKHPSSYPDNFHESKCFLTVSVGQLVHEKDKFASTIYTVNKTFKECVILVDDTLQRYTKKIFSPASLDELHCSTYLEGDTWLERNQIVINSFDIDCSVFRWDHWLKHKDFMQHRKKIDELYVSDSHYKNSFVTTALAFIQRRNQHGLMKFDEEQALYYSIEYLKEESAMLCLLAEIENYAANTYEVYPSERNAALVATHEYFIKPVESSFLMPITIKFKNRKSVQNY